MNKEKLMQFISEAIDRGDHIDIFHYGHNETKQDAQNLAIQFSEIDSKEVKEIEHSKSHWYQVRYENIKADFHYPNSNSHFMEEDINFEGDENIA